jgi:hypothetical protein
MGENRGELGWNVELSDDDYDRYAPLFSRHRAARALSCETRPGNEADGSC